MKRLLLSLLIGIGFFLGTCEFDEDITKDSSAKLNFSTDTVFFDTLFRTVATATKRMKAYNPNDESVRIDEIALMGGEASKFRVNINGEPVNAVNDLKLRAKDSLFVFVELTIDQSRPNNPYLVRDSLRFLTNGNEQFVNLTAYGRHVIIHREEILRSDQTWNADTPHLIVDFALVDSTSKLQIPAGTEIYGTGGSGLFVEGSLEVSGTANNPVTFEGARPEPEFEGEPGQWQGIRLLPASKSNVIEHAIIKEGNVGLQVDSFASNENVKLRLQSTRISDMANVGLAGFSTSILAQNSIVNDCCGNLVACQDGGTYQFLHCTLMASTCVCSPDGNAVVFENDPSVGRDSLRVTLLNSIAYSFKESAIQLQSTASGDQINPVFRYSLIKVGEQAPDVIQELVDTTNLKNERPLFESICENDFNLTEQSTAIDAGMAISPELQRLGLDRDFQGDERQVDSPDMGAIEFKP